MNRGFKRIKRKIKINKFFIIVLFLVVVVGVVLLVPSVFASLQPIKSVEIFSSKSNYSSKEEGSWRVTNSAEFASSNTALVTMNLDTIAKGSSKKKDVVFLIDTSESMLDAKLSTLKSSLINSVNKILDKEGNNVALITFNNEATKISRLNNNKDEKIDCINNLTIGNGTSYYQALLEVENILKIYTLSKDREFNIILITDGAPSKDRPNDVALYKYLKDAYSFINIRGVQYEAGDKTLTELENVSDKQFVANKENLEKYLISSATSSNEYESFIIKENLNNNNFNIESINDIKVNTGSIELNNNVVTWNLDNISSGSKAKMTFKAKLKTTSNGAYELNNNIEINSTIGGVNDAVTSTNTPVLSNNYKVKYDGNKPSDCTISGVPTDATHKVFETVSIADSPKCNGYQFKGWDIVTDNVTKVNDDYFVMPEEDVELKANWSKLDIKKSTDGEVEEGWTLYKQVKSDAGSSNRYAKKYTGDTSTFTGNNDVYYYYGEAANNNVVFANYCWKIVRTTDTGGVKLLYNGVPSNGTCNNTEDNSVLTKEDMNTVSNNIPFNTQCLSVADVGYMYNKRYLPNNFEIYKDGSYKVDSIVSLDQGGYLNHSDYYSDSFEYRDGKYCLINPIQSSWNTNTYKDLVGKYTSYWSSCQDSLHYVIKGEPNIRYSIVLNDGKDKNDSGSLTIKLSQSIINNNGTYTLVNPITVNKLDWITDYANYKKYYICKDFTETCSKDEIIYIYDNYNNSLNYGYKYVTGGNFYKYGNSYTYNNGKYILVDTVDNIPDNNHHYTCLNSSGECNELSYVYYSKDGTPYYINLTGGKGIDDAINDMLNSIDVNKNNSNVKTAIDNWFSKNMINYIKYLEDTVWCNDRSISTKGGWGNTEGNLIQNLTFNSLTNSNNLVCKNKNDQFTVDSKNGNGALTYPVGLITRQETYLAYSTTSPLAINTPFWGLSPALAHGKYGTAHFDITPAGFSKDINYLTTNSTRKVRPSVSLQAGIEYESGDGSIAHPYIILLD